MNSLNTIRNIIDRSQWILRTVLDDTTPEQINENRSASVNTIGAIYAHAVINLDLFFNQAIRGGNTVLDRDAFAGQLGLPEPESIDWGGLNEIMWDKHTLQSYARAVTESITAYLETFTDAELIRPIQLFGRDTTVGDTLTLASWHSALHAGEIAALKGVRGEKGLPF